MAGGSLYTREVLIRSSLKGTGGKQINQEIPKDGQGKRVDEGVAAVCIRKPKNRGELSSGCKVKWPPS